MHRVTMKIIYRPSSDKYLPYVFITIIPLSVEVVHTTWHIYTL